MKNVFSLTLLGLALAFSTHSIASDDRPQHFKGKPSETLEQALENFSSGNQELAKLLQGTLDNAKIAQIHELTYTLENALEKLNAQMQALAETLEELHVASEHYDPAKVASKGQEYLSVAQQIVN